MHLLCGCRFAVAVIFGCCVCWSFLMLFLLLFCCCFCCSVVGVVFVVFSFLESLESPIIFVLWIIGTTDMLLFFFGGGDLSFYSFLASPILFLFRFGSQTFFCVNHILFHLLGMTDNFFFLESPIFFFWGESFSVIF